MRLRLISALISLLVLIQVLSGCSAQSDPDAAHDIRFYQLLPVARKSKLLEGEGSGEAIALLNTGEQPRTFTGWVVQTNSGKVILPKLTLQAGQIIYMANDASYFSKVWNFQPDFEYGKETDKSVPDLIVQDERSPVLNDKGDVVRLLDEKGAIVDVLAFGSVGSIPEPWSGPPVQLVNSFPIVPGNQVITRMKQGKSYRKEAKAEAWSGGTPQHAERVYFPGQSDFPVKEISGPMTLTAASAPDNAGVMLFNLIDQAKKSIRLVGYQFTNKELADQLINAVKRGVRVQIGIERNPSGADMFDSDKEAHEKLHKGGVEVLYYYKWDGDLSTRFNPVHSKYAILDDETVLISSGNWTESVYNMDPSCGNREWMAAIKGNSDVVKLFREVWDFDFGSQHAEVRPWNEQLDRPLAPDTYDPGPCMKYTLVKPQPLTVITQKATVTRVLSPDNTMDREKGFLSLLMGAKRELLISANYINKWWGAADHPENVLNYPQPYLQEIVAAARRGVSVKVILDRRTVKDSPRDNQFVVEYLNDLARQENLKLEARLVCMDCTGIGRTYHNKSLIVDDAVVISSINGSENSFRYAREFALKIDGVPSFTQYYRDLFTSDWEQSARPNAPTGVRLMPREHGTYVDWSANFERDVDRYEVYRKSDPNGAWRKVGDAPQLGYEDDVTTGIWGVVAVTRNGVRSNYAEASR